MRVLNREKGPGQPCGECRACCTTLSVVEIGKPADAPCPHECASGCAIYETRPQSCRTYSCEWRNGWVAGRPEYRPDRLGLIFNVQYESKDYARSRPVLIARQTAAHAEVHPDPTTDNKVAYLVGKLRSEVARFSLIPAILRKQQAGGGGDGR